MPHNLGTTTKVALYIGKPTQLWDYEDEEITNFPSAVLLTYKKKEKSLDEALKALFHELTANKEVLVFNMDNYNISTYQILFKEKKILAEILTLLKDAKLVRSIHGNVPPDTATRTHYEKASIDYKSW